MAIRYESVLPWGRSFDEYNAMFALSEEDLSKNILGCGDGPASFNRFLSERGGKVVSADPVYCFTREELKTRIGETFETVMEQTKANIGNFVWDRIPNLEALGKIRMRAMNDFLEDYDAGKSEGRYINAALPGLPFADGSFDLALVSHFLFLYSNNLDGDFHIAGVLELCRVAREVRIFPVLDVNAGRSPWLASVLEAVRTLGRRAELVRVDYEFQHGGNEMLRIL
jgi:hypothetical protein